MKKSKTELIKTSSPHIFSNIDTSKIMWLFIISLIPPTGVGIFYFGAKAAWIILISVCTALITETILCKLSKRELTISNGSAIITGLLIGLTIPSTAPFWIPVVGSFVAIFVGKFIFGGKGNNIFNPALVGRAFVILSWPSIMATWITPDGVTGATPMSVMQNQGLQSLIQSFGSIKSVYSSLFYGNIGGAIGEVSAFAILISVVFLIYFEIIDWRIPISYVGVVFILTLLLKQDPVIHILGGGLLFGAVFMATDPVTSPVTKKGRWIFGIGCALFTVIIRMYASLPEGITYSILLMNSLTPLIDSITKPQPFGWRKKKND